LGQGDKMADQDLMQLLGQLVQGYNQQSKGKSSDAVIGLISGLAGSARKDSQGTQFAIVPGLAKGIESFSNVRKERKQQAGEEFGRGLQTIQLADTLQKGEQQQEQQKALVDQG